MINIQNLSKVNNDEILECFNHSFSDYSIPFRLDLNQLEHKLNAESINKEISIGAFKENRLVGFVLHGERGNGESRIAYNAGTGVRPIERGQKLTRKMYDYIIPILQAKNFESVDLEVISNNFPAIKSYETIGFKHIRDLNCYKAELNSEKINNMVSVKEANQINLSELSNFGEIKPSWQNANKTIFNLGKQTKNILAYYQNEICGYCVLNSNNNRILQIAVKKQMRKKGVGSSILNYINHNISSSISIINVDSRYDETLNFFERNNFAMTLRQKEMKVKIASR